MEMLIFLLAMLIIIWPIDPEELAAMTNEIICPADEFHRLVMRMMGRK